MSDRLLNCLLICMVATFTGVAGAATYYVDNLAGLDGNSGTSSNAAWQSLGKVSGRTFQPGDRVLFKAGGSWTGELDLNGNGTLASPIVVDQYGSGPKPFINGGGYECAVRLQGVSYWEVNNLELSNDGGPTLSGPSDYRAGVLVKSAFTAIRNHIYLRNLTIHDIFPTTGAYGHGIHVIAACSGSVSTYYDDVRIENCQISRTGRFGVWVQQTGSTAVSPAYQFIRNVIIRGNTFLDVGGSGAETGWCDGVLLESNIVHRSGASVDPRQWARGSGYWPWKCRNVLVQCNEFRHARGEADSCGVHIDYGNRDVTIQYNLSLDNEGGFVEILGDCVNSIYRYNVSINDGARLKGVNGAAQDGHLIWLSDYVGDGNPGIGATNSMIYNNTIYVRSGITNYLKIMAGTQGTYIANNIFYLDGRPVYTNAGVNTVWANNLWYGNVPTGLPPDPGAVFAHPLFATVSGTNAGDYLLSPVSPAIGGGASISNNGGRDYWANPLPGGAPAIGAHQRDFSDAGVISVNLTEFATTNQQILSGAMFGVPAQNSLVSGWVNLNQTLNATRLPFANGWSSPITMSGAAPNSWATANVAYESTPLVGGIDDYPGTVNPTGITLTNLAASFPNGYKVIAYLSGYLANTGASIGDGTTTFYYRPLTNPAAPVALMQATLTTDPGTGNAPFAQYAVFGETVPHTNNSLTLTLRARSGGGAILGGFQILATGALTPQGVPYGWYQGYQLPVDDFADVDLDGRSGWEEFAAGTNPTNALSQFRVIEVKTLGPNLSISWLGGPTGYQGNWSMSVSSNLTDWSVVASRSIPRGLSGINTWVHTNGVGASAQFYRPFIEYAP